MKFPYNGGKWYIDKILATQLLTLVYNIKKDWDFVLLISGDRMVRVGKSVLGMTICSFLAYAMGRYGIKTKFDLEDVYFDNKVMMSQVYDKPQYSINMYDEGREGLAATKTMHLIQQDILDFFAECGQLNQIFVIVLPDFFELKEPVAIGRSEFLLNVYRKPVAKEVDILGIGEKQPVVGFQRGFFQLFNRQTKAKLYDKARTTRRKNYGLIKANVIGRFTNQYPLDEALYRAKKREALKRFQEKTKEDKVTLKEMKETKLRNLIITKLHKESLTEREIVKRMIDEYDYKVSKTLVNTVIRDSKSKAAVA
jgi:hypothetical protein